MKAVYRKRLLKLAAFLDTLPREKFDFAVVTRIGKKPMLEALKAGHERCGTVGCAIGWMPAVFPRLVRWDENNYVCLKGDVDDYNADRYAAERFFDLSDDEASCLFVPESSGLGALATPKQVARHIRQFVRAKEKDMERAS
jgi:hypothetical protein